MLANSFGKMLAVFALLPLVFSVNGAQGPDPVDAQLRFDHLAVYKYDGYQPYDVVARLVDGSGNPVTEADVQLLFASLSKEPLPLKEVADGYYMLCDVEWIDATSGALTFYVSAEKKGMVSIVNQVTDRPGNRCGAGNDRLVVAAIQALKPDSGPNDLKKRPLDLMIKLVDGSGKPVSGAIVTARATDFARHVDGTLTEVSPGIYESCAFGWFSGSGEGAVAVHISTYKRGFRETAADGKSRPGSLCALPNYTDPPPSPPHDRIGVE